MVVSSDRFDEFHAAHIKDSITHGPTNSFLHLHILYQKDNLYFPRKKIKENKDQTARKIQFCDTCRNKIILTK